MFNTLPVFFLNMETEAQQDPSQSALVVPSLAMLAGRNYYSKQGEFVYNLQSLTLVGRTRRPLCVNSGCLGGSASRTPGIIV